MAAGALLSVSYNDWFPVAGLSSSAPTGMPAYIGARGALDPYGLQPAGALTIDQPIDNPIYPGLTGAFQSSYFNDFYDRLHIIPSSIALGAISGATTVNVLVWNAYYRESQELTSVTVSPYAGITLSGPVTPAVLGPLVAIQIGVTAGVQGPAIIDELIHFVFDMPLSFDLPVTGVRARTWAFEPAWGSSGKSYEVTYSFATEVIMSRNGKEQRVAQRLTPRKSVAFRNLLLDEDFREAKGLLRNWQQRAFVIPEFTQYVDSVAAMAPGSLTMTFAAVPSWAAPGFPVILRTASGMEAHTIEEVTADSVTFRAGTPSLKPAGTRMYAGLNSYVSQTLQMPRMTDSKATLDLTFDVIALSEPPYTPAAASTVFNGREVFLKRPNWAESVEVTQAHEVDELDFGRGATLRYEAIAYGSETKKATYVQFTAAEAKATVDFFRRMLGRQGEFYMPTWEYDFIPVGTVAAASAAMRVKGVDVARFYADSTVYKAVFVLLNNGSVLLRKVMSITEISDSNGDDSIITVDQTWGTTISQDTIVMCGWMPAWRFVSDDLTVEWLTDAVAQVQMTMTTIEDLDVNA